MLGGVGASRRNKSVMFQECHVFSISTCGGMFIPSVCIYVRALRLPRNGAPSLVESRARARSPAHPIYSTPINLIFTVARCTKCLSLYRAPDSSHRFSCSFYSYPLDRPGHFPRAHARERERELYATRHCTGGARMETENPVKHGRGASNEKLVTNGA